MSNTQQIDTMVSKPRLANEFGVHHRTLGRWMDDPALNFPRPIVVRGRNFFSRSAIEKWKQERAKASVAATGPKRSRGDNAAHAE